MGWRKVGPGFWGFCCVAGLGFVASAAGLAAGLSFDVKPGLWDIETSGAASGIPQIPPDMLEKLKPDQRVMAEAMLLAVIAQASMPHSMQFCVTPAQLHQGLDLDRIGGKHCQRTVRSSSPTGLDMQVDCSGHDQMSGNVRLRVVDRATIAGDVDFRAGLGANSMTIRQTLHGKWLGAECGEVQPFE
jgi:hypothetical protein